MKGLFATVFATVAVLGSTTALAQKPLAEAIDAEGTGRRVDPIVGSWKMRVPDALRNLDVGADLAFKNDGTFVYIAQGARKTTYRGKFELRAGTLNLERLRYGDAWPEGWNDLVLASFDSAGRLSLEGLEFDRSIGELLIGTWVLQGDKGTRFELKKDGSFRFLSLGTRAESKGKWEAVGSRIELRYTEVDGEKVDFDMKTTLEVAPDLNNFTVSGRFRYLRG